MNKNNQMNWEALNRQVVQCRKCPRLVSWREQVALQKRKAYMDWDYWGKPIPGFGDVDATILVLGLAPGAHGSNRTGRMFTGDSSGDFLFPALHKAGFASQPDSRFKDDGLILENIFITAVCRCVPPKNRPLKEEIMNCRSFLLEEMCLLENLKGIIALGHIAFDSAIEILSGRHQIRFEKKPNFQHGKVYSFVESPLWLMASYHPSRQNTQTGRLTTEMFDKIWREAREID